VYSIGILLLGIGFVGWGIFYKNIVAYVASGFGITTAVLGLIVAFMITAGQYIVFTIFPIPLLLFIFFGVSLILMGITFYISRMLTGRPVLCILTFCFALTAGILHLTIFLYLTGIASIFTGIALIFIAICMFISSPTPYQVIT
jgi:hypothetical protein